MTPYAPAFCDAMRQDTLWLDSLHIKDIKRTGYTRFTPDDLVLRAFEHVQTDRFFLKAERQQPNSFSLFFSYGSDRLPELTPLNFNATDQLLIEPSARRDTITYWLRDTTLVNQDTLNVAMTYLMTTRSAISCHRRHAADTLQATLRETPKGSTEELRGVEEKGGEEAQAWRALRLDNAPEGTQLQAAARL